MNYTIARPRLSAVAWGLALLLVIGLIGLGIAAFEAFNYMGRPFQAAAFALVIELGMIWESISIIRRNWFALPGLVVSIIVSGTYNFTQAQHAGSLLSIPITDPWQLAALSIGPLSATFFVALSFGKELRTHEIAVAQWQSNRQQWIDDQRAKAEALRMQEEERARQTSLDAQKVHEDALIARERMQLEAQERADRAQLEAQERAARARARQERAERAATVHPAQDMGATARAIAQEESASARGTYPDFELAQRQRNGAGPMTWQEIAKTFGVSRRTAYNWLDAYQKTQGVHHEN